MQRDQLNRNTCVRIPDDGPHIFPGKRSTTILNDLPRITICIQEIHGKKIPASCSGTGPTNPSTWHFRTKQCYAGGSAICIRKSLLLHGPNVTHVITCQGHDHIVTTQSGDCVYVVVNVHDESGLTLRSFRERLRLIALRWPCYPGAFGVLIGDFNICEPEEGRFNVWNQTFTDGDAVKTVPYALC